MIALDDLDLADATVATATKPAAPAKKSVNRGVFYFDLETVPDYERLALFDLDAIPDPTKRGDVDKCPPAADLLKQTLDKIKEDLKCYNPVDAYLDAVDAVEKAAPKPRKGVLDLTSELRRQDAARDELIVDQRKKMSVTPEFCKIVAMGWAFGSNAESLVVGEKTSIYDSVTERDILENFWDIAKHAKQICGFNILGFDLPVIFIRSIILDVAPSRQFDMKPWGTDVIDLMAKRFPKSGAMDLKRLAKLMGIEVPAGDVDGSQVEQLWKESPAKVGEYVRSDIEITRELHRRYAGFFC